MYKYDLCTAISSQPATDIHPDVKLYFEVILQLDVPVVLIISALWLYA